MVIKAIFNRARNDPHTPAMSANGTGYTNAQLAQGILDAQALIESYDLPPAARIGIAIRELDKAWLFILAAEKLGRIATCLPGNSTAGQIGLQGIGLWIADRNVQQSWTGPTLWIDDSANLGFGPSRGLERPVDDPVHEIRFVLYSSGTTGLYKRIARTAASRSARIASAVEGGRDAPGRRHYAGDFGPWTAYGYTQPIRALTLGSLLVFEQRLEPWKAILAHRPTDFFMTPGTARRFFNSLPNDFPRQDDMTVIISGGALTPSLLEMVQQRLTAKIVQKYASTETGLIAQTTIAGAQDLLDHRLIKNSEIQAVGEDDRPLPFGSEGILRVRRDGMSTEYFEDPVSTAAHFRDGWFYPGDIGVVFGPDKFRLTGRASEVINANGDKIAPSVIEDALRQQWLCDDIAALSQAHTGQKDSLHVFVVRPANLDEHIVKKTMRPYSPSFSAIRVHNVSMIPRTTTGKIQYRILREALPKQ